MSHLGFHSGLWIDQEPESVEKRIAALADPAIAEAIRHLVRHGYCILPRAIPHELIDRFLRTLHNRRHGFPLKASVGLEVFPIDEISITRPITKLLDTHFGLPQARAISLHESILSLLTTIFEEDVLAFQSLYFEVGSTQAIHQDTAYVVVDRPSHFLASWVALEDIRPGSGELAYYPGSHRFPHFLYGEPPDRKHWDQSLDGHPIHDRHLRWLHEQAAAKGIDVLKFHAAKGDVLLWHSDLAHGGAAIVGEGHSRRSLVTHYCPLSATPRYLSSEPSRRKRRRKLAHGPGAHFSSGHYRTRDLRLTPLRAALAALRRRPAAPAADIPPAPRDERELLLREVIAIREAGQPQRSLARIAAAREAGETSPWLDDNEARALADLGHTQEALGIWRRLSRSDDTTLAATAAEMLALLQQAATPPD